MCRVKWLLQCQKQNAEWVTWFNTIPNCKSHKQILWKVSPLLQSTWHQPLHVPHYSHCSPGTLSPYFSPQYMHGVSSSSASRLPWPWLFPLPLLAFIKLDFFVSFKCVAFLLPLLTGLLPLGLSNLHFSFFFLGALSFTSDFLLFCNDFSWTRCLSCQCQTTESGMLRWKCRYSV